MKKVGQKILNADRRQTEQLQKTIEGLEYMKMTLPMIEAHRDTIVAALVILMEMRLQRR